MTIHSPEPTDADAPVTRRELREELQAVLRTVATKEDVKGFATKEDLKAFATKEDLKAFATKEDLKSFATKEDLKSFATKEDLKDFPTRSDPKGFATKDDLNVLRDELRLHMEIMWERSKGDFQWLHEWVRANVQGGAERLDALEAGHRARLEALEHRMSIVESRRA